MRIPRFNFKRVISMTLLIFVSWTIAGAYTIVFYGRKFARSLALLITDANEEVLHPLAVDD